MSRGLTFARPVFAAVVLTLAPFVLSGCGEEKLVTSAKRVDDYDVRKVVEVLQTQNPTVEDSLYLARVPKEVWPCVEQWITDHDTTLFLGENGDPTREPLSPLTACSWSGSTRRDEILCWANSFQFQGHNAVYFVVDADANCYNKDLDWWVAQCVPPQFGGCVSSWDLFLASGRYWSPSLQKWVKNVVLLVPTTWWSGYYWHWPADFKASRFVLSWNATPNGCCE
ncbi:MAG: hypothetical protein HY340_02485 [Candidatus Kerfeldbacteria bacterium]|nr:hypothetical protein [Candidatus Kerfeldbacteria bacterium]